MPFCSANNLIKISLFDHIYRVMLMALKQTKSRRIESRFDNTMNATSNHPDLASTCVTSNKKHNTTTFVGFRDHIIFITLSCDFDKRT